MEKTIESKTAETILERKKQITIGDQTYEVAPPTMATLILVSELVSQLPQTTMDPANILTETLRVAKDCRILGDIIAVLILGEENINPELKPPRKTPWWALSRDQEVKTNPREELAAKILKTLGPKRTKEIAVEILKGMEIADFFGLTTSLIEVNLTQKTREVEKTTASGQS